MIDTKNTSRIERAPNVSRSAGPYLPFTPVLAPFKDQFSHAFVPNWDGQGAPAITPSTMVSLDRLISRFASSKNIEEVSAGSDGSISVVWEDAKGNYVFLGVGPGQALQLYYTLENGDTWEGVSLLTDARILTQLRRAFGFLNPSLPDGHTFRDKQTATYVQRRAA